MLRQLQPSEYDRVRPFFAGMPHHLAISSVLDGTNPGSVYAADADSPGAALLMSTEGTYLVGDPDDAQLVEAVARQVDGWAEQGFGALWLDVEPPSWHEHAGMLFGEREVRALPRRHYSCTQLALDWRANLPEGFAVRPVDEALLGDASLDVPEHLRGWVRTNWVTVEAFAERGFGCCTVQGSEVASWSLADCVSGDRVEIGIRTAEGWRRRGLAKVTAAAAVEYAFSAGYREVGWHCDDANVGSWRTAEAVGFEHDADYTFLYCRLAT